MDLHSILKRSDTSNRLFQKFVSAYTAKAQEVQVARQVHKTKGDISKTDILYMVADKFQQESAIEGIVGETNVEEQMLEMKRVGDRKLKGKGKTTSSREQLQKQVG